MKLNLGAKFWLKVLALVIVVCFFCPFASCSAGDEKESFSGVELATTVSLDKDHAEFFKESEVAPNIFLILAFVCAVGAAALLIMAVHGALFVMLVIFRLSFFSYYDWGQYAEYAKQGIEFRWGYHFSMILSLVSVFVAFMHGYGMKLLNAFVAGTPDAQPKQAPKICCGQCGAEVAAGVQFCGNCGAALKQEPAKCPYCKTELKGDSQFCGNCGAKLQ